MSLFDDETRGEIERRLAALVGPVKLVLFTDPADVEGMSSQVRELLTELAGMSERVTLEEHVHAADAPASLQYSIARAPAIAVLGARDHGIRYYGAPAGYEFGTLLEVMDDVARGQAELPPGLAERLAALAGPVHIQVFSTPT